MKNIKNNPKVNEIIPDNINYSYYKETIDKNERLKSERNYLLNYLANVNMNMMEKNIENVSKRIALNDNKKDKEEGLKKLADDIDRMNLKIENIEDDIQTMNKEKKNKFG
jgi:seryl-tRNA synthetase